MQCPIRTVHFGHRIGSVDHCPVYDDLTAPDVRTAHHEESVRPRLQLHDFQCPWSLHPGMAVTFHAPQIKDWEANTSETE